MYGLTYEEEYFFKHNVHVVEVVVNVLKDMGLSVFNKNNNGVAIYGLDMQEVKRLFKDMALSDIIYYMDYQIQYGYDEFAEVHDNKDCVEVTFKSALFDLND